ncbi:YmdB family metallophosphoesterase [Staphylococcus epidermidis]
MRILFIGDIVGKVGRKMITTYLPKIKQTYHPTVSIVNAENAAHGKGLTEKNLQTTFERRRGFHDYG